MDYYTLLNASKEDVDEIFALIIKRIKWMDENGINQWNKTNYLDSYPKAYFEEKMLNGQLYVMKEEVSGKVAGAVVLLEEDKRWDADSSKSFYIHNLVSDTEIPGVGSSIMHLCEQIAINNGKDNLRLDCQATNEKLNEFYNNLGYKYVGPVQEGSYVGSKREKKLK